MANAYIALEQTFKQARLLAARVQEVPGFRQYVTERLTLVIAAAAVFLLISVACAAGTVMFFADRHPLLALPGIVVAVFVLVGSLFVQGYVFLAWLENRSIAYALARRRAGLDFGRLPPVPWVLAAFFVFLPFAMLAAISATATLVLILLAVGVPTLFANFDR